MSGGMNEWVNKIFFFEIVTYLIKRFRIDKLNGNGVEVFGFNGIY